jgi:hypothetical protein
MIDSMHCRFGKPQLQQITEQGIIYMCACPAGVAKQMLLLRELYDYQEKCVSEGALMNQVHVRIAAAVQLAYAELERCLDEVLDMEGWDRLTLTMPADLRQVQDDLLLDSSVSRSIGTSSE